MYSEYTSNKEAVYDQLEKAFADTVQYYFDAIKTVISIDRHWPGFQTNPFRDVIDTGAFKDSQEKIQIDRMQWNIYWGVAYSTFVFFGGVTRAGAHFPGRRVDLVAAQEVDLAVFFIKAFLHEGNLTRKGVVLFSGQEL